MCFTPFVRFTLTQSINTRCAGSRPLVGGKKVPGYREEEDVSPDSQTETFVALRLFLDNWRWQDVPFYLRTGKQARPAGLGNCDPVSRSAASVVSG
jgi:hypothetical protein